MLFLLVEAQIFANYVKILFDDLLLEVIRKHSIAEESLTVDGRQQVVYLPFASAQRQDAEIEELKMEIKQLKAELDSRPTSVVIQRDPIQPDEAVLALIRSLQEQLDRAQCRLRDLQHENDELHLRIRELREVNDLLLLLLTHVRKHDLSGHSSGCCQDREFRPCAEENKNSNEREIPGSAPGCGGTPDLGSGGAGDEPDAPTILA